MEKQSMSDQRIIDCLITDYGLDVAALTFLPWGADMNASVYKAQAKNKSFFVKLKHGHHHELSVALARLLHDAGISQIIPPINTIEGQPTLIIDDFTLIVYPFVEGQDGFSRNLTDAHWITLGQALRQVHEMDIPLSIQNQIRKEAYSPKWREAVRLLYAHVEGEHSGDEVALKLLKFMKENIALIRRLVDRAEQLSQKLQEQSSKFVLCHSDIHGGNVLIDGKDRLYIVDWDEPIMAPIERDLMFIGGGVANVWNKPHEEALFYQGYGKTDVNKRLLTYYRHERIVEDIAVYGHDLLLSSDGGENRSVMYKHFIDMFEPRGVVEIAFRTDEL
ncbi:MAG: aminoglycoside phosphotransferase family protein [Gammaproteobacteria bacterium]|nr:aminoglycoside phosphotransferase family protein [Gammaproteobacteria bacterium]